MGECRRILLMLGVVADWGLGLMANGCGPDGYWGLRKDSPECVLAMANCGSARQANNYTSAMSGSSTATASSSPSPSASPGQIRNGPLIPPSNHVPKMLLPSYMPR